MSDSLDFFNALRPKIHEMIVSETADFLRLSPYVVTVPPDPDTHLIGVTRVTETNRRDGKTIGEGENIKGDNKTSIPPRIAGRVQPGVNDMPVACQSRRVTEPQREGPFRGWGDYNFPPRQRNESPVTIFVHYHSSLSSASVGDPVLLVYRGNLSNAYALPSL